MQQLRGLAYYSSWSGAHRIQLLLGMQENQKKEGLDEADNELICPERGIFTRGIPKNLVINPKVELAHLSCQLCNNVIWKPVACSQTNCFANFCEYCVSSSLQEPSLEPLCSKCPKCAKPFHKTSIPLVNSLLSDLQLLCMHSVEGCSEKIGYDGFLKHCLNCDYRKVQCEGCRQSYLQKNIQQHQKICSFIVVSCQKCGLQLPQADFKVQHSQVRCLELQLKAKTASIESLENSVEVLKHRLNEYQVLMERIIKGDNVQLPYELYSSFPTNFSFLNAEVRLNRSSWNSSKQKYDFLHFYITSQIKTESPIGFQWKLLVKVLKGNLLIGICSSLLINSVDFVINRFGEIKKKESTENKYKLIRKGNLTFSEGDVISFKYMALRKTLKIQNETKKVECLLESKEIGELGENLYSFYSLDTVNDAIKFL